MTAGDPAVVVVPLVPVVPAGSAPVTAPTGACSFPADGGVLPDVPSAGPVTTATGYDPPIGSVVTVPGSLTTAACTTPVGPEITVV